jgi:hypothetical protein
MPRLRLSKHAPLIHSVPRRAVAALLWVLGAAAAISATPPPAPLGAAPDPASIDLKTLPAGNHRELVIRTCAVCHPIDIVVQKRRTQDEWDTLIARMVDHGAHATDTEQDQIFEYLVRNFGSADAGAKDATTPAK